ncbi:hypothetical protein [Novosphingobium mangrovi (ex Huang et al. 2023)]|uniref:Two component regulator three Y domain-containing protein n=1 Tax=Novosphingobium mangrovi (ex Huang et al. 2023) TaxID=2976432 RepID=A0ABT2I566_9SPHN|nr:hypothetical protein [Novosphingobium mangrovi (ex Huang et al. 2023)]MCT2399940.1 hypothetical protein [Novosphingobium mangrovi (ex Huang et al. 2023)]
MAASPAHAATPQFTGPVELESDAGNTMLSWQADGPVLLQIADAPDLSAPKLLYEGQAKSYFLSGLANGDYYLRLKGVGGTISAPLHVSVVHQSLTRALLLVAIGALVTLAIVVTILWGARDE